ncbi:protein kinase, partial [Trypanosoma conorhini]
MLSTDRSHVFFSWRFAAPHATSLFSPTACNGAWRASCRASDGAVVGSPRTRGQPCQPPRSSVLASADCTGCVLWPSQSLSSSLSSFAAARFLVEQPHHSGSGGTTVPRTAMSVTEGDGLPGSPASLPGDRGRRASGPDRHVRQDHEGRGRATESSSHKQQESRAPDALLHAAGALRNTHGGSGRGGSSADVQSPCEPRTGEGPLAQAGADGGSGGGEVPGPHGAEGGATRERPSTPAQWGASFGAIGHANESSRLGAERAAGPPDDAGTGGGGPNSGRPGGRAPAVVPDGWGPSDNAVANEAEVSAEPENAERNVKAHGMPAGRVASVSRARGLVSPTDSPPLRVAHLSPWRRTLTYSLRCWVLCPLVVLLVVVAVITMALAFPTSKSSSQSAFFSLHELVVASMEESVGSLTLTKMARMAVATGSMYFSGNTFPNPRTDILMPLESGMMSRLCAVLRDMDPAKTVASLGAVSLTRQQAAVCITSRSRPGSFVGTVSQNGAIDGFYYVD